MFSPWSNFSQFFILYLTTALNISFDFGIIIFVGSSLGHQTTMLRSSQKITLPDLFAVCYIKGSTILHYEMDAC